MRILGLDPGTAITGWGILDFENQKFSNITAGAITTPANQDLIVRLNTIYTDVCQLINQYHPNAIAVEKLFFNTNAKTAMSVGHARGVLLLAIYQSNTPCFEYTPLQIKQAITGYGRADKPQMQAMVKTLLNLKTIPKPDDAADALAAAITHAFSYQLTSKL